MELGWKVARLDKRIRSLRRLACAFEARRRYDEAGLIRRQADIQALLGKIEDIEASSTSSVMLGALGTASAVKWVARLRSEVHEQEASVEALRIALLQVFRRQHLIGALEEVMRHRDRERGKAEILAAVTEQESVSRFAQDMEE